jgi:FdhE protein
MRGLWQEVCAAVRRHQDGEAALALAGAARDGRLDLAELTREVLAGRPESVHARADVLGLDATLTATVLRLTLFPFLSRVQAALAPLREGIPWGRGYCPTCGSWPLLGEFRGLEQNRFLRCGLCAAEWECPRLFCPFCGTRDHERLGFFAAENEESRYRAATCDDCRGYVKMVTTLTGLDWPQLLVADVATLYLDLAAAERSFLAPA